MDRIYVRFADEPGIYRWRLRDAEGNWRGEAERGSLDILARSMAENTVEIWLLLPGEYVVTQVMDFTAKERRHLARIAPFQFEESVAADIDSIHFSLAQPQGEQVAVAYSDKQWLVDCLTIFEEHGVDVNICAAEPLMLPRSHGQWCLRFDQLVSVHYGSGLGFAIEPGLVTPALEALLIQVEAPERVLLLADDSDGLDDLEALLPAELQVEVEQYLTDDWDSFCLADSVAINLRQGELARRLPIERWWGEWRTVAAVALVAVVTYAGSNIGHYQILKGQDLELRRQTQQAYRDVVPSGRISDAEKQLKVKVDAFKGSTSVASVVQLFAEVGPLIAAGEDISLQGLNYTDKRGELRINVQAKTFNAIEQLRVQVEKKGLQAELLNASAQGEGHQARLRINRSM